MFVKLYAYTKKNILKRVIFQWNLLILEYCVKGREGSRVNISYYYSSTNASKNNFKAWSANKQSKVTFLLIDHVSVNYFQLPTTFTVKTFSQFAFKLFEINEHF